MLNRLKNWLYMRRYPDHIKRLQAAYTLSVKQHKKRPDLVRAMNEQLKKELKI